jgi:hypothetical protein
MDELKNNCVYHIRVTNLVDRSEWDHRRVPASDVHSLMMNKNLSIKVVRLVGSDERFKRDRRR